MTSNERDQILEQAFTALSQGNTLAVLELCRPVLENNLNDAECWSVYGMAGMSHDPANAIAALERATKIEPHEPRWLIHYGIGLKSVGQPGDAAQAFERAAQQSDMSEEAVIPWTVCLMETGEPDKAIDILSRLHADNPSRQLSLHYAQILADTNDLIGSVKVRESIYNDQPMPREEQLSIANMHVTLGQYDQSQEYVDALMNDDPSAPDTARLAANLLRWRGELDQAHDVLSNAYKSNKSDPQLLLSLLDLNRNDDEHLIAEAKGRIEDDSVAVHDRRGLAFVVARRADKAGKFDEAWHFVQEANTLYTDGAANETPQYRVQLRRALALYNAVETQENEADAEHIYVVGPPRSGGSLLQTILAADPGLVSVGERGALMAWILPVLDGLDDGQAAAAEWNKIAAQLPMADTAGMRSAYPGSEGKNFVDKMPHHAHVAGMLARVHKRSQFIDVRRDPYDVAMSILLHDFTDKFGYSRSIDDIAQYLVFQRDAINNWRQAGVEIHIHDHDEFTGAPIKFGRDIFNKLGLQWHDKYLEPESRQSTVRTFSALQVRSKVTKAYSGRGQNYKEFIGKAADILDTLQ